MNIQNITTKKSTKIYKHIEQIIGKSNNSVYNEISTVACIIKGTNCVV